MAIPRSDAAHLLRRAGFGGTLPEIDALAASPSWEAAVDRVLDTSADPPVGPQPRIEQWQMGDPLGLWPMQTWWYERMRTSPCPIVEKMALFWHGHLTTHESKTRIPKMWRQLQLYRTAGLGNYEDLVRRMAVEPSMLTYLDNAYNRAPNWLNENFGRELMEVFVLGPGTHSQADVRAMTRAWSGHSVDDAGEYQFLPHFHDDGPKTLFGITRNWDGPDTVAEMLRGSKAVVASRFLAAKLWSFFAAPDPSPALVDDLAATFRASGLDLRALVRAVFLRPEFRAPATRVALVRSPTEFMVSTLRSLGVTAEHGRPYAWAPTMGQELFRAPSVQGWKQNGYWLSSSAAWAKAGFLTHLKMVATAPPYDRFAGLDGLPPDQVATVLFDTLGIVEPSPASRRVVEDHARRLGPTSARWLIRRDALVLAALSPDHQLA